MSSYRRLSGLVGLAAAVIAPLVWSPVSAEVGAMAGQQVANHSYIIVGITDDPEPVGIAWQRHHPIGPAYSVLNEQGQANGDGPPSMVGNQGEPVVVWALNGPAGFDVVYSRFSGGSWTAPQVLAGGPFDELDPVVTVNPSDGSIHVVYWVNDGAPRVMHRQAPADFSGWSAPVQVSQLGEIALRPGAVIDGNLIRVAYETHDLGLGSTPRQIVLATRQGSTWSWITLATTDYAGKNAPTPHCAAGTLWIDWVDAQDEMAWTREIAPDVWQPVSHETFSGPEERDYHVRGSIRFLALE